MRLNLFVYITAIVFLATEFCLSMVLMHNHLDMSNSAECRVSISSEVVYVCVQLAKLGRVSASCFMNLRYSRPFDECKKEFVKVFCNNSDDFV